jgi:hypothetical protein
VSTRPHVRSMVQLLERLAHQGAALHELQRAAITIVLAAPGSTTSRAATQVANIAALMQSDPIERDTYAPVLGDWVARLSSSLDDEPRIAKRPH